MVAAKIALITFVIPFLIALIIRSFFPKNCPYGNISSVMSGLLAASIGFQGLPVFPPANFNQNIFYLILLAGLFALLSNFGKIKKQSIVVKLIGLILFVFLLLNPLLAGMGSFKFGLFALIFAFLIFFYDNLYLGISKKLPPEKSFLPLIYLLANIFVTSLIIILSGSALIGQLTGALGASLVSVYFLKIIRKDFDFSKETFYSYWLYLGLFWFTAYYLVEVPVTEVLLLIFAPLLIMVNYLKKLEKIKIWQLALINLLILSLPLLISLAKTLLVYFSEPTYY